MRLIDADALNEAVEHIDWYSVNGGKLTPGATSFTGLFKATDIFAAIENAPTVEAVILPCKLGDPVYVIRECSCHCADVHRKSKRRKCSEKVYLGQKLRAYHCGYVTEAHFELKHIPNFGKMVFLTREEAEAALAKMGGDSE